MADNLFNAVYNPDVLSCLANLSNDEVFTPPDVVNKMLDMLPQELFRNPDVTFLDPACKTGVFLREIAKRLIKGLEPQIPDLLERIDHIFHKQLYAIAITELTSLLSRRSVYCSKYPNSEFSVTQFNDAEGNIRFRRIQHKWKDGRCIYCGAAQSQYDRGTALETHAYELIHTTHPEEIFDMHFDVIISNPPYQLSDGGAQASATPIYQRFVTMAQKLKPNYITMIIPSRWFAGGRGLDDFRKAMICDKQISELHDFLNANDCFGNGVEIKGGVCYFLWEKDRCGDCKVVTHDQSGIISEAIRPLKINDADVFVRRNEAISILEKVSKQKEASFAGLVSAQRPFGLRTYVQGKKAPFKGSVKLFQRGGIGYIAKTEIDRNIEEIEKWHVFISRAYNAGDDYPHQIIGKPLVGEPNSCCTETYVSIGPFENQVVATNVQNYMMTKFFRFMVSMIKVSQMASSVVYTFVPMQDYSKPWTDEELYAKYGLNNDEIAFIDSMIKPMDLNGGDDDAD